jgi:hypothetical protein
MIKQFATYVIAGAVSFACLGLLALVMAQDTIKDTDAGSPDE